MAKPMPQMGGASIPRQRTRFATVGPAPAEVRARTRARIREVDVSRLRPYRLQPPERHSAENVADLARSIAVLGLQQPPLVRPQEGGTFVILAGHRRVSAWKSLVLDGRVRPKMPVYVLTDVDDREALYIVSAEAFHHRAFGAVHEAEIIGEVLAARRLELGREPTTRDLAAVLPGGKSAISESLTICHALNDPGLAPLVRQADNAGKSLLYKILRTPDFETRKSALEAWADGGKPAAMKVLSPRKRGRPAQVVVRRKRGDGYDLTVRLRPGMAVREAAEALAEVEKLVGDLQAIAGGGAGRTE